MSERERGDDALPEFAQLVFAGGGTRCFWHGGFLSVTREPLGLRPERISGASGGALSAATFIAGREQVLLETMCEAFERVDKNIDLDEEETAGDGLTPHQRIYGEVVARTFDEEAVAAVADGPAFQVLLAHPPSERGAEFATLPAMLAYQADKAVRSSPHMRWPLAIGLEESLVDARQAARDGKLVDLVRNAAVIPPVFNLKGWEGRPVVDGGMISAAPMPEPDAGLTLVLLTRHYRNLPCDPTKFYIEPASETPADKLDFTDPDKLRRTWELGRRDGERFLERFGSDVDAGTR